MRIGARIRSVREVRRISVEALAKLAGMRVQFLKDIESGRVETVHSRTVQKLSDHLDVPFEFLLSGDKSRLPRSDRAGRHFLIQILISCLTYGVSILALCCIMALVAFAVINLARTDSPRICEAGVVE